MFPSSTEREQSVISCKRCHSENVVKNGEARGQQRYRCKDCRYNFIVGDRRVNDSLVAKKALAVILYSLSKASFSMLGRIFGVSRTLTYRWIKAEAEALPEPEVPGDIQEMELDEMWHFIGSKKTSSGLSRRWIVARGEPWPGSSVVVMLQLSDGSTPRSNT
jgi:transposase